MKIEGFEYKVLSVSESTGNFKLFFKNNFYYFDGHFEGFPVVPALIQIDLVVKFAKNYLFLPLKLKEIPVMKFVKPIMSSTLVDLKIEAFKKEKKFEFSFENGDQLYSKGSLLL